MCSNPTQPRAFLLKSEICNLKSLRAILFDAVGTLIHAQPPVVDVYTAVGRGHSSQLGDEEVKRRFHAAMRRRSESQVSADAPPIDHAGEREMWREIVVEVFDDLPRETAAGELFESLWTHFALPESWRLYHDVAAIWRELEARGYLLGVASNFDDRLRDVCRGLPPLDTCENAGRLFWSARLGFAKPNPAFFRCVERELQLEPYEVLLVGDDWTNDITGASGAGWSAVFLDRSEQENPPGIIASLAELPKLLAS